MSLESLLHILLTNSIHQLEEQLQVSELVHLECFHPPIESCTRSHKTGMRLGQSSLQSTLRLLADIRTAEELF